MRFLAATLATIILCVPAMGQEGRTFVERLPMDTPQETAKAFIEAFNAKDFATAYYMLSPEAKRTFVDSYYAYTAGRYFNVGESGMVDGSLLSDATLSDDELAEVGDDTALIFDNLVFHADANGEMPFSLANAAPALVEPTGEKTALITVEGGQPATILMDAELLYNGDWRIDRIHWAGSDSSLKPWGLSTGKVKKHEPAPETEDAPAPTQP